MVQVRIVTAFGPGKLEESCNAILKELYHQRCVIFRVERIIYDVVNEIYTLMIVYQTAPEQRENGGKS